MTAAEQSTTAGTLFKSVLFLSLFIVLFVVTLWVSHRIAHLLKSTIKPTVLPNNGRIVYLIGLSIIQYNYLLRSTCLLFTVPTFHQLSAMYGVFTFPEVLPKVEVKLSHIMYCVVLCEIWAATPASIS